MFKINSYTSEDQNNPAIAVLSNGGYVIVWQSEFQDGSGLGIFGQRISSSGAKEGHEFQVNTYTQNNQRNAAIASILDGGFVTASLPSALMPVEPK